MSLSEEVLELTRCYRAELAEYREFLQVSRRLNQLLRAGEETSQLGEILNAQTEIIRRINDWDEKATKLKESVARTLGVVEVTVSALGDLPEAEGFREVLGELGDVLKKLEEVETENQRLLQERLELMRRRESSPSPKQAGKAYQERCLNQDSQIDKKR